MDGTITVPAIDFVLMRSRLKIPAGQDILSTIRKFDEKERINALEIIEEIELMGRKDLKLTYGANELMHFLDKHSIRKGLVTRNSQAAVDHLLTHLNTEFNPCLTRSFEPFKPDPAPALHCLTQWGFKGENALFVGDFLDDLLCGTRAGTMTCLLLNEKNSDFKKNADITVHSLHELMTLLDNDELFIEEKKLN